MWDFLPQLWRETMISLDDCRTTIRMTHQHNSFLIFTVLNCTVHLGSSSLHLQLTISLYLGSLNLSYLFLLCVLHWKDIEFVILKWHQLSKYLAVMKWRCGSPMTKDDCLICHLLISVSQYNFEFLNSRCNEHEKGPIN